MNVKDRIRSSCLLMAQRLSSCLSPPMSSHPPSVCPTNKHRQRATTCFRHGPSVDSLSYCVYTGRTSNMSLMTKSDDEILTWLQSALEKKGPFTRRASMWWNSCFQDPHSFPLLVITSVHYGFPVDIFLRLFRQASFCRKHKIIAVISRANYLFHAKATGHRYDVCCWCDWVIKGY